MKVSNIYENSVCETGLFFNSKGSGQPDNTYQVFICVVPLTVPSTQNLPDLLRFDVRLALNKQRLVWCHVRVQGNEVFGGGGTDHGAIYALKASTALLEAVGNYRQHAAWRRLGCHLFRQLKRHHNICAVQKLRLQRSSATSEGGCLGL
jgi:hypothetical protein